MFYRVVLMAACLIVGTAQGEASVFISEYMADVSTTEGDANQDGVISSSQDEFIELYNPTYVSVDVSGWEIYDGVGLRHTFSNLTVLDSSARLVVFGGGAPTIPGAFQIASSGGLGLNNTGDTISLYDDLGNLIDQVIYGREANVDQSLVRETKASAFIQHSEWMEGQLYSPGSPVKSRTAHAVPEPMTMFSFVGGLAVLWQKKRKITI